MRPLEARALDQPHDKADENDDAEDSPPAHERAPPRRRWRRRLVWLAKVLHGLSLIGLLLIRLLMMGLSLIGWSLIGQNASHSIRPPLLVEDGGSERDCQ